MKKLLMAFATAALLMVCLCVPAFAADESFSFGCSHLDSLFNSGTVDGLVIYYDDLDHYVYCLNCDVYCSGAVVDGNPVPHEGDNCEDCMTFSSAGVPVLGQLPSSGSDEGIISSISPFVTNTIDWVSLVANCIVNEPLLLMFVCVSFVGIGIGFIKRIIHL